MIFLGRYFFGYNDVSLYHNLSKSDDITTVILQNAKVDAIHIEKTDNATSDTWEIPTFDWNTLLSTHFNSTTNAGNTDWVVNNVSAIYIKMRKKGEFKWITISVHPINELKDFSFGGISFLNASLCDYEIAFVPIINGIEGTYSIYEVHSEFDGLMLVDKDGVYTTDLDVDAMNTERSNNSIVEEGMYNKYPYYYKFSECEYDKGTVEACWIEANHDTNEYDIDGRNDFVEKIKRKLCKGKPMLLKHYDGRNILVAITDNPTDSGTDHWKHRLLKFSWVEIGDAMNEKDLYDNGISDISHEYFSQTY